jgi:hypothetical protein
VLLARQLLPPLAHLEPVATPEEFAATQLAWQPAGVAARLLRKIRDDVGLELDGKRRRHADERASPLLRLLPGSGALCLAATRMGAANSGA